MSFDCFSHASFVTVIITGAHQHALHVKVEWVPIPWSRFQCSRVARAMAQTRLGWTQRFLDNPQFNYEPFNSNSINICSWSWNYRGCWHQTCPPIVTRYLMGLDIPHCKLPNTLVGIWKTYFFSLPHHFSWHWAICAPAALRRSGSRFSGSLSGIEP